MRGMLKGFADFWKTTVAMAIRVVFIEDRVVGASNAALTLKGRSSTSWAPSNRWQMMLRICRTRNPLTTSLRTTNPSPNDNCSNGHVPLRYREIAPRCGKHSRQHQSCMRPSNSAMRSRRTSCFGDAILSHKPKENRDADSSRQHCARLHWRCAGSASHLTDTINFLFQNHYSKHCQ